MVGPGAKREGFAHLQAVMGLSERRPCSIVDADRKMIRYRSRRAPDTELRMQLRDLANAGRRFGYRRLFILRQDDEPSGINRIYRLDREEGLTVPKRRGRRRAAGTRAPLANAGRLCRQSLCNVRSAAQPRLAQPIARCPTRAPRRKTRRGSNRRWMKVQWQVKRDQC